MSRALLGRTSVWLLLLAVALPLAVQSPYWLSLATYAVVLALLGTSLNLVLGYLGQVSFGHAAFYGLGAYVAGLLAVKAGMNFWLAVPVAVAAAALVGALLGLASQRVVGAYLAIASLTIAEIFRLTAANWIDLTRGPLGVVVPREPVPLLSATGLTFQQAYLLVLLLVLAAVVAALERMIAGPVGRAWAAIREAPDLAEAVGVPTMRLRVANVTLSGAIAGLAGALVVPHVFVLSPDLFGVLNSAIGLLVAILGGKGTIVGPIVGGAIFAGVPEMLRAAADWRDVLFALLLFLAVRFVPGGLAGPVVRRLARRSPEAARSASPAGAAPARIARREPDDGPILAVEAVGKSFRGLQALSNVSFSVQRGEIFGLIGPNGAGKTTCLSIASGFLAPDAGTVAFEGQDIAGKRPHRIARRGLVRTFQHTTLCASLTCLDNALVGAAATAPLSAGDWLALGRRQACDGAARRAIAEEALAAVGLEDRGDATAGDMPYGDQKRLSVAVALAARPTLLVLDEPAAGLNPTEALALAACLKAVRDRGVSILVVDHNMRMMMGLCDRIAVLHHGERIALGTPAEVAADPAVLAAYLGEREAADA